MIFTHLKVGIFSRHPRQFENGPCGDDSPCTWVLNARGVQLCPTDSLLARETGALEC